MPMSIRPLNETVDATFSVYSAIAKIPQLDYLSGAEIGGI